MPRDLIPPIYFNPALMALAFNKHIQLRSTTSLQSLCAAQVSRSLWAHRIPFGNGGPGSVLTVMERTQPPTLRAASARWRAVTAKFPHLPQWLCLEMLFICVSGRGTNTSWCRASEKHEDAFAWEWGKVKNSTPSAHIRQNKRSIHTILSR